MSEILSQFLSEQNLDSFILLTSLINEASIPSLTVSFSTCLNSTIKSISRSYLSLSQKDAFDSLFRFHKFLSNYIQSTKDIDDYSDVFRSFKSGIFPHSMKVSFIAAKACDLYLKNNELFQEVFSDLIRFISDLNNMDAFIEHHRYFLSYRLMRKSSLLPSEQQFLDQFEQICVNDLIKSMELMIKDLQTPPPFLIESSFPIDIIVLSQSNWPILPEISADFPEEISLIQTNFIQKYSSLSEKKIFFIHYDFCEFHFGNTSIKATSLHAYIFECYLFQKEINCQEDTKNEIINWFKSVGLIDESGNVHEIEQIELEAPRLALTKLKKKKEFNEQDFVAIRTQQLEAMIVRSVKILKEANQNDLYQHVQHNCSIEIPFWQFEGSLNSLLNKCFLGGSVDSLITFDIE